MTKNKSLKLAKEFNMIGAPYISASDSVDNYSLNVDVPDSRAFEMQQAGHCRKKQVNGSPPVFRLQ